MHLVRLLTFLLHSMIFGLQRSTSQGWKMDWQIHYPEIRSLFLSQVPQAARNPSAIPLVDLVAQDTPWTSTVWIQQFSSTIQLL